ncbi:hypothetical protein HPB50_028200 [Hyalomma asiaticum]|nr:hypothetical protein HPB50_028200 [Hyalomma asiaticum]
MNEQQRTLTELQKQKERLEARLQQVKRDFEIKLTDLNRQHKEEELASVKGNRKELFKDASSTKKKAKRKPLSSKTVRRRPQLFSLDELGTSFEIDSDSDEENDPDWCLSSELSQISNCLQVPEFMSLGTLRLLKKKEKLLFPLSLQGGVLCSTALCKFQHTLLVEENAYTTLKQLLISRLTPSEPQRLEQLLHDTELGDRTPSQLLRHMRQLLHTADATTTDADSRLLRELFLQRLPVNVRMILASAADKRLSELAELADSVLAVAPPHRRPRAYDRTA